MSIKLQVLSSGLGTCALTGKSESDGLLIAFENEAPCFISWKAFKQLLLFKMTQAGKTDATPHGRQATPMPAPCARPQ